MTPKLTHRLGMLRLSLAEQPSGGGSHSRRNSISSHSGKMNIASATVEQTTTFSYFPGELLQQDYCISICVIFLLYLNKWIDKIYTRILPATRQGSTEAPCAEVRATAAPRAPIAQHAVGQPRGAGSPCASRHCLWGKILPSIPFLHFSICLIYMAISL